MQFSTPGRAAPKWQRGAGGDGSHDEEEYGDETGRDEEERGRYKMLRITRWIEWKVEEVKDGGVGWGSSLATCSGSMSAA